MKTTPFFYNPLKLIYLTTLFLFLTGCSDDSSLPSDQNPPPNTTVDADINKDGKLNILIIGSSKSINSSVSAFSSDKIGEELKNILTQDASHNLEVTISFEDIYKSKVVTYGLGQSVNTYNENHYAHSLLQYYYWPENQEKRFNNLASKDAKKWDYVIITADPYIIAKLPGYYSLGVHKIAQKVAEGGAKPLLLMQWSKDETLTASINHFSEYTYRTADGSSIETIPAGLSWKNLPSSKKDKATTHPTPNGAYLAAAAIYTHILDKNATTSKYEYDNSIADIVLKTKNEEKNKEHYSGNPTFISPFMNCDISDNVLNYNHTGTSSENGILNGLKWVFNKSSRTLVKNGTPPINFNYGRANTNFEPNKRYKIDPTKFDFSFGFPMQDNGNHGNTSMLYGLDKRYNETNNSTDLGTALYMVRKSELPNARAIPIRTLYAQLKEAIPSQSAYSDNWHMHGNLDKATAAYMYTMLTGNCVLGSEPTDKNSNNWKEWMSQKIGHETAYRLAFFKGINSNCK
ncbi:MULTISPECIES: hypothetical protein [unclassified Tenacibaculum]|uniref:hypothetical protein n=1 Tax=unclassified Tenacibaculum TaxID=2635139 RepID=UPI001F2F95CD|nr:MULTISPECIES: hypothetical protein [unclassified Tenacibaculum]MCF2873352.1 hypothetical protein [Tenacibaculum sp. Cn5-1]MCF2933508.1 hypothetical protein [Tenacibaculum sp. Cn5-34]MCG7509910.1 hypothetical protein [Tenacibaculum sp. Cn5-46]